MALGGCAGPPEGGRPAPPVAPTYADLAAAHNERVAALERFHGDGVVEIRWIEDDRDKLVQGDVDLWVRLPRHTALRVSKLGDDLLWVGSDEERYWLFDLRGDETSLRTAGHERGIDTLGAGGDAGGRTAGLPSIRPLALLDLMGLVRLPTGGSDGPVLQWSPEHEGWVISVDGAGGALRLVFDPATLLPKRAEHLDGAGTVILHATLERYQPVTRAGLLPLAWPRMAAEIAVRAPQSSSETKIFLDGMSDAVSDERIQALCDVDRLIEHLRPDVRK
jgi:hypothetical protein